MSNSKVQFIELTQQEYDDSLTHLDTALYFTTDTHKLYKGSNEIGGGTGSNDFIINYTYDRWAEPNCTSDKTIEEVIAADAAGMNLKAIISVAGSDNAYVTQTLIKEIDDPDYTYIFSGVTQAGSIAAFTLTHRIYRGDEEITFET